MPQEEGAEAGEVHAADQKQDTATTEISSSQIRLT